MKNNLAIMNKTLEDIVRTSTIIGNKIITDGRDFEDFKELSSRKIDKVITFMSKFLLITI